MGNKMKKLLCTLLASAMLISSAGAVAFAAPEDTAAADETVTVTADGDSSTADVTDEEKETEDTNAADTTADTTADNTSDTADAAPAVTEAPASGYDADNYYQKSLALCSSLGIISGYEDGSVRPESKVTRAEMASIVLRMLALQSTSSYKDIFTDVTSAHWAADQIQSAYEATVVSGMGDGTFQPDSSVTYAQVIVMLVNAMNYQNDAEYYGGWQDGYIKVAGDIGLLKNAAGSADEPSDRGVVIKMVYNALLGDYKEITSYENGQPKYTADKTLAESKFDVIEGKGTLLGTAKTTITDTDIQDGQLEIRAEDKTNKDNVTDTVYNTILTGLEDLLAQKVTYYYRENLGTTPEVLAVTNDSSKSETYMIDDVDTIESFDNVGEGVEGSIKIEKVSKAKKIAADAVIVYNGKIATAKDWEAAKKAAKPEAQAIYKDSFNEFLQPEVGTIKLVNTNKSDNDDFDVVFVDSYETMVVVSASDEKLIGKVADPEDLIGTPLSITIDLSSDEDRTITVKKAGSEIRLRNLKKNDVASIKRSLDNTVVDIVVSGDSVTGSATSMSSKKADETTVTVNNDTYDVANVAVKDLKTGTQSTFHLDMFGRIAYIESSTSGRLGAGEKYGWLMQGYNGEGGAGYMVNIMTQEGKEEGFKLASKVDYWAPKTYEVQSGLSKDAAATEIKKLFDANGNVDGDKFPKLWYEADRTTRAYAVDPTGKTAKDTQRPVYYKAKAPIALIKYKTNSKGEITKLYGPVSTTNNLPRYYDPTFVDKNFTTSDWNRIAKDGLTKDDFGWAINNNQYPKEKDGPKVQWYGVEEPYITTAEIEELKKSDALIIDGTNKSGSLLRGGLVGGYVITDDIIEFCAPDNAAKYKNAEAFTVGNVVSSKYNLRENGLSDDYIIADPDGTTPGAIARWVADSTEPVNPADLDNVGNTTSMIVDSIDVGVDDEDNTIYTINGYLGGNKTSVTTSKTSALGELRRYDDKKYSTTAGTQIVSWSVDDSGNDLGTVWQSGDEAKGKYLTNYLHEGDIIITNGNHILIYASAQDVYTRLRKGESVAKYVSGSETRNYFWFDAVTDSAVDDIAWMNIGTNVLSADATMPMDIVEIDLSKSNAEKAVSISDKVDTISDVMNYSNTADEYDYAYARFASKGSLQEVILYRIKNAEFEGADAAK